MRARGCLIAVAVVLSLSAVLAGVFGPGLLRRAKSVYAPISRMKGDQQDFEAWVRAHPWHDTGAGALTPEKLDAFLALRRELWQLQERTEGLRARAPQGQRPRIEDVSAMMEGVGGLMAERFQAFRRQGITPAEYEALERLVYTQWLPALVAEGDDPAARERAAAEIDHVGQGEPSAPVRARLAQAAATLRHRVPAAPEGIPAEVHRLLLARAAAIEAQPTGHVPALVPRGRERGRPAASPSS